MSEVSYVSGAIDTPLLGMSIGEMLRKSAREHGERDAIVSLFQETKLTYAELDRAADQVAGALLALGVGHGDRVAIWSANRIEWVIAHHGAVRIGAIAVTVNPAFRADEAAYILENSGAVAVFASSLFRGFSYVEALESMRRRLPELREVVLFDEEAPAGYRAWPAFLELAAQTARERVAEAEAAVSFDTPANLQYTSGTTGRPKGAMLTHHGILNNGYFVGERQRLTEHDKICLPVPFFHCFGIVLGELAALSHGSAIVLPSDSFEPMATMRAIETERCTSLYGVPMMFIALLTHPEFDRFDFSSLRTGAMGAAPCPLKTMKDAVERMHMLEITNVYGMTETSPISFQSLVGDDNETRCSTVGRIHPHLEAKIVDSVTNVPVPKGSIGELCIRGYSVMSGYWKNEEATRAAVDSGRWMHTGDLAVMRADGYVQIVGRLKDTIIRGGENIYPREIEEFLITLPPIAEAYVFGMPDEKYGEEVYAWVRPRPGAATTEEALREMCRGRIAGYKIPRRLRIVSEIPTTASGKVQRFRMREMEQEWAQGEAAGSSAVGG